MRGEEGKGHSMHTEEPGEISTNKIHSRNIHFSEWGKEVYWKHMSLKPDGQEAVSFRSSRFSFSHLSLLFDSFTFHTGLVKYWGQTAGISPAESLHNQPTDRSTWGGILV